MFSWKSDVNSVPWTLREMGLQGCSNPRGNWGNGIGSFASLFFAGSTVYPCDWAGASQTRLTSLDLLDVQSLEDFSPIQQKL